MKINKLLVALAVAGMVASPMAAYSQVQTAKPTKQVAAGKKAEKPDFSFLNGKTGTMTYSVWSEESLTAMMNAQHGIRLNKFVYADSIAGGLAMLKSDRADFMMTTDITANYIIQRNPELKSVLYSEDMGLTMLLRAADVKLMDSLNSAISKLKASGKIDELYKKWVKELPVGQEPAMAKIEKTAYPETVYVGVSGDMPPLDYVAADGKPAGYNIALLAEISKLLGKNIEVVSIDSPARLAALQSKKIDVFFWQRMPKYHGQRKEYKGVSMQDIKNFSKNFILTKPYCPVKTVLLMKK